MNKQSTQGHFCCRKWIAGVLGDGREIVTVRELEEGSLTIICRTLKIGHQLCIEIQLYATTPRIAVTSSNGKRECEREEEDAGPSRVGQLNGLHDDSH